ncbi:translation initiation factor IF-2-like [Cervus elaphus]|uniref:translation initiation factor IF-2-like n=1 Tax=Cervus elaphus TaxID=9860 RepID=UPI001CC30FB8|nr:translation initiation factor IF-2-like [Cervus elaphus]
MRRRRAEPPASRTRAAVPPPAPRPLAIGRRPDAHAGLARCRGPAGPGSCRAGRTGRRLHKGWRGGDGGREGGKEVPGATGRSGALGARGCRGRRTQPGSCPRCPRPTQRHPEPPLHLGGVRPALPELPAPRGGASRRWPVRRDLLTATILSPVLSWLFSA